VLFLPKDFCGNLQLTAEREFRIANERLENRILLSMATFLGANDKVKTKQTAVVLFLFLLAVFCCGCVKLPGKFPLLKKKNAPLGWKETSLHFSQHTRKMEFMIRSHQDLSGKVSLFTKLIDGFEFGCLQWLPIAGEKFTWMKCWKDRIVDLAEIRWANDDRWFLFVWESGEKKRLRTIAIFDPRVKEIFAIELEFRENKPEESAEKVSFRFSWNLGFPQFKKYRDFLETIKTAYADPKTWGKTTRGLKLFRRGETASVTFELDSEVALLDSFSRENH